ncbi:MAG: LysR family transcriptional regulator [Proteobacteria bacterium]|nr:LysR family transcriptional regulator [Pseudomonadota bacterium]MBS0271007.1 LysR family transcriptional regulator [Pseudomonadota bacterium]
MTLEQMKIFREAARFGSFTVAADHLGLTQSAVSMSIKKIEERNNIVLFERAGKGLVLTDAGQFLFREVSRNLANLDLLSRRLKDFETGSKEPAAVACTQHVYNFWMPGIVSEPGKVFRSSVDLIVGAADDVTAWVMRGTVDMGLTERQPCHPLFEHANVFNDRIILVAASDKAQTVPDNVGFGDLEKYGPVIWALDDHDRVIGQALSDAGVDPSQLQHSALRFETVEAVLCSLRYGRAIGFVSEAAASSAIAANHLRRVGELEIELKYYLFCKKGYDIANIAKRVSIAAMDMTGRRPG